MRFGKPEIGAGDSSGRRRDCVHDTARSVHDTARSRFAGKHISCLGAATHSRHHACDYKLIEIIHRLALPYSGHFLVESRRDTFVHPDVLQSLLLPVVQRYPQWDAGFLRRLREADYEGEAFRDELGAGIPRALQACTMRRVPVPQCSITRARWSAAARLGFRGCDGCSR
jgi:hypothetical protein